MVVTRVRTLPQLVAFAILWLMKSAIAKKNLRLLGLQPMGGKIWIGGNACVASCTMALNDINSRSDILPDFNLTYDYVDSQCLGGPAVFNMFEALYRSKDEDDHYNMVVGPACSVSSQATAEVSHLWNVTQLSHGGSSPVLSDRDRYPYFYRMGTPDQKYIMARIDLMKRYNWRKVATIHQAIEFFSVVSDDFIREMINNNITVTQQEIFLQDPFTRVQNLKENDARIIYGAMYEDRARQLLCAAYKVGLYGPKIVWILPGWYSDEFWKRNIDLVDCTQEQMSIAAEGVFLVVSVYFNPIVERGLANLTVPEFKERYFNHPLYNPDYKDFDFYVGRCYDHLWLSALALNCTHNRMVEMGHPKTLDQFEYTDVDINKLVFECMGNVSLTGVSGRISFETGDPDKIVKLERITDNARKLVAYYRQDKKPSYYEWQEGVIIFKDGVVPRDSTLVVYKEAVIPQSLLVFMCTFAGFGIILAAFFFTFNIIYRGNKIVKLSSPNINNILLFGCILCYITVFLQTVETTSAAICTAKDMASHTSSIRNITLDFDSGDKVRVFTFCLGFTITFGSLFSKTWRVYRIFTNKKLLRRSIKDIQLLVIIGVFVAVVLTVLMIWQLLQPHVIIEQYLENEVYTIGNDEEIRMYIRLCHSPYSAYFGWAIYVIEGALLAFGAFLAWETRQVKIEALNDSHQIGLCLYNVVILSAVGLTLSLLLDQQVSLLYGVTCGCLVIGTTLTQLVVFIPKVYTVLQKVDNKSVTAVSVNAGTSTMLGKAAVASLGTKKNSSQNLNDPFKFTASKTSTSGVSA